MRAEDFVRQKYPKASLKAVPGTYIGGKVRYEVFIGRVRVGRAMTERSAWADAMRWIKRKPEGL